MYDNTANGYELWQTHPYDMPTSEQFPHREYPLRFAYETEGLVSTRLICERLDKAIRDSGKTREAIASAAEVVYSTFEDHINHKPRNIRTDEMWCILAATGVSIHWLRYGDDEVAADRDDAFVADSYLSDVILEERNLNAEEIGLAYRSMTDENDRKLLSDLAKRLLRAEAERAWLRHERMNYAITMSDMLKNMGFPEDKVNTLYGEHYWERDW